MSHDAPLLADDLLSRCRQLFAASVQRLCELLPQAIDVLERHVKERYAPTSHRAARAILSLTGLGRMAAELVQPKPPPQEQEAAAGRELSPATLGKMLKAINAVDRLGLGQPIPVT